MFEITRRNSRPNMLRTLNFLGKDFDDMSSIIDNLFHFHGVPTVSGIDAPSFSPSLNISEEDDKYLARIELPGIDEKNVSIYIDEDDTLIISGEKKLESKEEKNNYCVKEICYGKFRREIPLPHNVNIENVKASFKKGILEINIPKIEKEEKKSRKIEIK